MHWWLNKLIYYKKFLTKCREIIMNPIFPSLRIISYQNIAILAFSVFISTSPFFNLLKYFKTNSRHYAFQINHLFNKKKFFLTCNCFLCHLNHFFTVVSFESGSKQGPYSTLVFMFLLILLIYGNFSFSPSSQIH